MPNEKYRYAIALHDGIENVISFIEPIENDKVIDPKVLMLHLHVFDSEYGIDRFEAFDKTRTISVKINDEPLRVISDCIGLLFMNKASKNKTGKYGKNGFDASSRKYRSYLAILDEADVNVIDYDSGDILTETHNPRHKVIDPIGGGG